MKSNLRNEIKSYIVRSGYTMQEVVDRLSEDYGWSDSVSNLSNKLQRESLRYVEAVQLADALGYDLVWQKRRDKCCLSFLRPVSLVPIAITQYCYGQAAKTFDFSLPPDGRCFTKHRLSGLNNRKRCRRFPGSSAAVIAMTAIPPRRAHGTLQPFGMKVS